MSHQNFARFFYYYKTLLIKKIIISKSNHDIYKKNNTNQISRIRKGENLMSDHRSNFNHRNRSILQIRSLWLITLFIIIYFMQYIYIVIRKKTVSNTRLVLMYTRTKVSLDKICSAKWKKGNLENIKFRLRNKDNEYIVFLLKQ